VAGGLELSLDLPGDALVAARIVNARGEILGQLKPRALSPGRHAFGWSSLARTSGPLPQGMYWLEVRASGQGWSRHQVNSAGILR
jgi:hypothetical protein